MKWKTARLRSLFLLLFVCGLCFFTFRTSVQAATEKAIFPMQYLTISQGVNGGYSHQGVYALDLTGRGSGTDNLFAPFTGKIAKIDTSYLMGNAVWLQSRDNVEFADCSVDYMTIYVAHDNDVSDLKVGQTVTQGTVFYQKGTYGKVTGSHIHLIAAKGKTATLYENDFGKWTLPGQIHPENAFFLTSSTIVMNGRGYNWRWIDDPLVSSGPGNMDAFLSANWVDNLGETNAQLNGTFYSKQRPSEIGFYLGRSSDQLEKRAETLGSGTSSFSLFWYDLNKWYGKLAPGTTYYYKFYFVQDGRTYESTTKSFTTKGTKTTPQAVPDTPGDMDALLSANWVDKLTATNAQLNGTFLDKQKASEIGFAFGLSADRLEKVREGLDSETPAFALFWYDLNKWYGELTPATTYYYKFYSVLDGRTYETGVKSFTTPKGTVQEPTEPPEEAPPESTTATAWEQDEEALTLTKSDHILIRYFDASFGVSNRDNPLLICYRADLTGDGVPELLVADYRDTWVQRLYNQTHDLAPVEGNDKADLWVVTVNQQQQPEVIYGEDVRAYPSFLHMKNIYLSQTDDGRAALYDDHFWANIGFSTFGAKQFTLDESGEEIIIWERQEGYWIDTLDYSGNPVPEEMFLDPEAVRMKLEEYRRELEAREPRFLCHSFLDSLVAENDERQFVKTSLSPVGEDYITPVAHTLLDAFQLEADRVAEESTDYGSDDDWAAFLEHYGNMASTLARPYEFVAEFDEASWFPSTPPPCSLIFDDTWSYATRLDQYGIDESLCRMLFLPITDDQGVVSPLCLNFLPGQGLYLIRLLELPLPDSFQPGEEILAVYFGLDDVDPQILVIRQDEVAQELTLEIYPFDLDDYSFDVAALLRVTAEPSQAGDSFKEYLESRGARAIFFAPDPASGLQAAYGDINEDLVFPYLPGP